MNKIVVNKSETVIRKQLKSICYADMSDAMEDIKEMLLDEWKVTEFVAYDPYYKGVLVTFKKEFNEYD